MATWKKVIVSGSNVSQLNNDAGYLTSATSPVRNAFASASVNGATIIADSASGSLTFASSSGQGLTLLGTSAPDTITFGLSAIPNASLANSTFNVGAGSGLTGGGSANLGGTSTVNVGAGTHITVNVDDIAVDTTTLIPAISGSILAGISGSIFSTVSGDITITSAGVATIAANSVALGTDTTGDYVANLGAGTGVTIGSNSGETSAPTIAVNYGSSANTAVQGSTTISVTGTANEVEITGTTAQALGGGPSYTIGLPNDVTIGNNLIVSNNLTVFGTASFQNTTNLEVADRFVLLASGSNSTGDGGLVIQQATQDVGELFGYDSGVSRWAVTSSFTANQGAFTPDAFMATVTSLSSTNPNTTGPAARYSATGNIFVSSGDESIWIYS